MADTNEKQVKQEKKNNSILVTCLVIVLMIACGFGGWLLGAMKIADKCKNNVVEQQKTKTEDENVTEENSEESETTVVEKSKPKCYGTYLSEDGSKKWTLREDGTFVVEGSEYFGVYVINQNTITFIESKHTTGPREKDPVYYNPKSYLISEDCQKIVVKSDNNQTQYTITKTS